MHFPEAERAEVAQASGGVRNATDLKIVERTLRRLAYPDVPEDAWEGWRTPKTDGS